MKTPQISNYSNFFKEMAKSIQSVQDFKSIDLNWIENMKSVQLDFSNYKYIDTTKILKEFSKNQDYSSLLKTKDLIDSFQSVCYDFGNAIKGFNESIKEVHLIDNESLSVPQIIFSETDRIKDLILKIYLNNEKLFELHPREFEKIIAELLYAKGFDVELTKQTRDNGYDILALKYIDDFSPIKYLVECKRFSPNRKVGVEIIRSFKDVISTEQANKGIIVTTSYFSKDAIKKQQETPLLLDYKNKDDIIKWVNDYKNTIM